MRNKQVWLVIIFIFLFSSCVSARMKPGVPPQVIKQLNLSALQEKQMQTLQAGQRQKQRKNMDRIKALQGQLDKEFLKAAPDENKIKSFIADIKQVHAELTSEHFNGLLAMRKILTKEQFAKMIQSRQKIREKFKQPKNKYFQKI